MLQKQVTNIEVNMAKKINQVLEAISQKKTPTYVEIASKNLSVPQIVITKKPTSQRISQLTSQLTGQAGNPTTVQKKPAEEPREKSVYREKRLILQTSKDFIENLDVKQIRDQVNDAFFKKEGETQPTIIIITKSQSNQSIVITIMSNFSAKYLVVWWGGWWPHHFSFPYSLCLGMSIVRHLHTRIRESILSISLSSRLSRAIGQSPYQSRVLVVTSRCVYRLSVV